MSKTVKTLTALTIAASAITPVAAQAQANATLESIVVSSNGQFLTLSKTEYNLALATNKISANPGISHIIVDGKTYTKAAYDIQVSINGNANALAKLVESATPVSITTSPGKVENGQVVGTPVTGDLKVESVSAINGTVTVKLGGTLETAPQATDFTITRAINNGTAATVLPTNFNYNPATKTATFTIPQVVATTAVQNVTVNVTAKGSTTAVSGSFTVNAAAAVTVLNTVGYTSAQLQGTTVTTGLTAGEFATLPATVSSAATDRITVIFSEPVDRTTATNRLNYAVNTNTGVAGSAVVSPLAVSLNTQAIGSFEAGRVATLYFTNGSVGDNAKSVRISGVKDLANRTVDTVTRNIASGTRAADTAAPVKTANGSITLTDGANTATSISGPNTVLTVNRGGEVTLTAGLTDALNPIVAVQYRLNATSPWVNMSPVDGIFNGDVEQARATIDTSNLNAGTYPIQFRAIDAAGNITAGGSEIGTGSNNSVSLTVNVGNSDVTPPAVNAATVTYRPTGLTNNALNDILGTIAPKTITVQGDADDNTDLDKVQLRIRQLSGGTFTVVQDWTNVVSDNGGFGGSTANQAFSFVSNPLTPGNTYLVEVRAIDKAGLISQTLQATAPVADSLITRPGAFLPEVTGTTELFTIAASAALPSFSTTPRTASTLGTVTAPTSDREITITGTAIGPVGGATVDKVEIKTYRTVNGVKEVVTDFTTALAGDGAFNAASEAFTYNAQLPNVSGVYTFEARVTDSLGGQFTAPVGTATVAGFAEKFLDVTRPTVTSIAPDTTTAQKDDFIVTFSEAVATTGSGNGAQLNTNYQIFNVAGGTQIAGATATTATLVPGTNNKVRIVFTGNDAVNLVAGRAIQVINVTDIAGNTIDTTNATTSSYTIKASDLQ